MESGQEQSEWLSPGWKYELRCSLCTSLFFFPFALLSGFLKPAAAVQFPQELFSIILKAALFSQSNQSHQYNCLLSASWMAASLHADTMSPQGSVSHPVVLEFLQSSGIDSSDVRTLERSKAVQPAFGVEVAVELEGHGLLQWRSRSGSSLQLLFFKKVQGRLHGAIGGLQS